MKQEKTKINKRFERICFRQNKIFYKKRLSTIEYRLASKLDIDTLYKITEVLEVNISQFLNFDKKLLFGNCHSGIL